MEKKLFFVFNPKAGKGKIKTALMDIVDIFNKGGYEVVIRATQYPKDAYEMTRDAISSIWEFCLSTSDLISPAISGSTFWISSNEYIPAPPIT